MARETPGALRPPVVAQTPFCLDLTKLQSGSCKKKNLGCPCPCHARAHAHARARAHAFCRRAGWGWVTIEVTELGKTNCSSVAH